MQLDGVFSTRELEALRSDLVQQFRLSEWTNLSRTLEVVSVLGQRQGQKELCLRAQSLRELMGLRAGGRGRLSGDRLDQLFDELLSHFNHLQWLSQ